MVEFRGTHIWCISGKGRASSSTISDHGYFILLTRIHKTADRIASRWFRILPTLVKTVTISTEGIFHNLGLSTPTRAPKLERAVFLWRQFCYAFFGMFDDLTLHAFSTSPCRRPHEAATDRDTFCYPL